MERFNIAAPIPLGRTGVNSEGKIFPLYASTSLPDVEMKWSGGKVPAVGERVLIRVNSIGLGTVVGYCESHGWLGLMVNPHAPPEWYQKQVRERNRETVQAKKLGPEKSKDIGIREWPAWILAGIAVVFGAEVEYE